MAREGGTPAMRKQGLRDGASGQLYKGNTVSKAEWTFLWGNGNPSSLKFFHRELWAKGAGQFWPFLFRWCFSLVGYK